MCVLCVSVYDATNAESFRALEQWLDEFLHNNNLVAKDIPKVLLANRSNAPAAQLQVDEAEAAEWAAANGMQLMRVDPTQTEQVGLVITEVVKGLLGAAVVV